MHSASIWIPVSQYPNDGHLHVLLISQRKVLGAAGPVACPAVGYRVNGRWMLTQPFGASAQLDAGLMVTAWQPLQYDTASEVTDDVLRVTYADMMYTCQSDHVTPADAVGWFRRMSAPLVAELNKLRNL